MRKNYCGYYYCDDYSLVHLSRTLASAIIHNASSRDMFRVMYTCQFLLRQQMPQFRTYTGFAHKLGKAFQETKLINYPARRSRSGFAASFLVILLISASSESCAVSTSSYVETARMKWTSPSEILFLINRDFFVIIPPCTKTGKPQNVSWKTASSLLSRNFCASVTSSHWQLPFSSFVLHCSQSWGAEGCEGVFSWMYMGYCVQFLHQCHLSIWLPLTYSTILFFTLY